MSNKVIFIFKAIDKYTAVGKKIASVNARIKRKFEDVKNAAKKFNEGLGATLKKVKKFGKAVSDIGAGLTARLTAPLLALGGVALKQSANLEGLGVSFDVLIGDAEKAKRTFDDLVQFTATTPFQLDNVANAGKQLLSFGVASEDLVPTLRMLGELAAGTGKPLEEFSLIFGKILAKGRVQGEEMLQLAEKGISLQTLLSEKFNVSGQVISDAVSKGQISFEIFNDVLKDVTGEGGKFNGLTERLSGTLGGLTSTLKDSTLLAFKELGDVLVKELKLKEFIADLIVGINKFTKSIAKFAKENPRLTKFLLILTGILIAIGPILVIVGQVIIAFAALSIVAGFLGTTVAALSLPFLAIIGVIGLVITVVGLLATRWDEVVAGFKLAIKDLPAFFDFILDSTFNSFGTSLQEVRGMITDIIESTVNLFRTSLQEVRGMITDIIESTVNAIDGAIQAIANKINAFKERITGFVSGITSDIKAFFDFGGDISTSSTSKTDINIRLVAPEGTIQSIKSKTTGTTPGLNVGVNMANGL